MTVLRALGEPVQKFGGLFTTRKNWRHETSDDHRDRLFVQVLVSLAVNALALLIVFHGLIPTTEEGGIIGGRLLLSIVVFLVAVRLIFWQFGNRHFCVNLLLGTLSGLLFSASFVLGGVMAPTMVFLIVIPVLSATLMRPRWAYLWTAITAALWLTMVLAESHGVTITNVTADQNRFVAQGIALLGTMLIVMAVLASYVSSDARLRSAMRQSHQRLDYLASHDPLTGIANRRAFFEEARRCLQRAERSKRPMGILVIDMNRFKQINDTWGHATGDLVLQNFAAKLKSGFREADFVGRLGGDEFGVLMPTLENDQAIEYAVERFLAIPGQDVIVDGERVEYGCDIGSATYPENGSDIVELYEAADRNMYLNKTAADSTSRRLRESSASTLRDASVDPGQFLAG